MRHTRVTRWREWLMECWNEDNGAVAPGVGLDVETMGNVVGGVKPGRGRGSAVMGMGMRASVTARQFASPAHRRYPPAVSQAPRPHNRGRRSRLVRRALRAG